MARSTQPIPAGFHTVTPSFTVRNCAEAIEFYKKALGAQERMRMVAPDGKITHAELLIGDSVVFLNDEIPGMGCKAPQSLDGTSGSFYLYVEDVDKAYQRAIDAGGKSTMPVTDMFWGDRFGGFVDPYGHNWGLSTHTHDYTEEELERGAKEFHAHMAAQAQKKSA